MGEPEVVARLRAAGCVFAEDEAALLTGAADDPAELDALVARRVAGVPLEQVLGWAEFRGLRILVEPGVFVPRRRSGLLVERAVAVVRAGDTVVDLCCGSGAIGAAVVAEASGPVELWAVDVDPTAVRCARRNLPVEAHVGAGGLYDPLPAALRGAVDVLVASVPYVPSGAIATMPPEARDHEPTVALDGGTDGLDVLRGVVAGAPGWLRSDGHLLVEIGGREAARAVAVVASAGFDTELVRDDDRDATVVVGRPGRART